MAPRIKHRKLTEEEAQASILGTPPPERAAPKHLSYSGRTTYEQCPKAYELGYIAKVPKKGSIWFLGGKAVHRCTEYWDDAQVKGEPIDLPVVWRQVFYEELAAEREKDPDEGGWRRAGITAEDPEGHSVGRWYSELGPKHVQAYIDWRLRTPQWELWTTPDGEPAIELDISGALPGMDCDFKGYIDRIFVDKVTGSLSVVDIKTGATPPNSGLQLGVYAAAVQHKYGVKVPTGHAFMTLEGKLARPWDLRRYTPEYVGRHFAGRFRSILAEDFAPKEGSHCVRCDVNLACYAQDGPLAARFDPDHPDYKAPF